MWDSRSDQHRSSLRLRRSLHPEWVQHFAQYLLSRGLSPLELRAFLRALRVKDSPLFSVHEVDLILHVSCREIGKLNGGSNDSPESSKSSTASACLNETSSTPEAPPSSPPAASTDSNPSRRRRRAF